MSSTPNRPRHGALLARAALSAALLLAAGVGPALAQHTATATDLGPEDAAKAQTVTLVLKLPNESALERYVADTANPYSAHFRDFLTTHQFAQRFAPSTGQVQQIEHALKRYGITVQDVSASHMVLHASGTTAQFEAAFSTKVRRYERHGHHFHRPRHRPHMPQSLADQVLVVAGLSNEALFRPMSAHAASQGPLVAPKAVLPKVGSTATGVPGSYTVGDVAERYNVTPLYDAGVTGKGITVGIATLANFEPKDAYKYWSDIGLDTKPNRIEQVHVDGGGPLSSADGSGETTLDVEQAGGLAPDADMIVYDAPNTDAGFIDVFAQAVSENRVDTLSVSWGSPEAFYFDSDLTGGDYTDQLKAFHQIFLEAAVQGITVSAAAGDSGAYDTNRALPYPTFSKLLSVDAPASDPLILAAGGTTVPIQLSAGPGTPPLIVDQEQAWSWTYIDNYLADLTGDDSYREIDFAEGTGGGVSSFWRKPLYQMLTRGMQRTESGQTLTYTDSDGSVTPLLTLPAHYAGRNLPDVSLNADPYSGYLVYSSTDGGYIAGYGGTSFVAPQLNGIVALLNQQQGTRLGLINPLLYSLHWLYGSDERSPFQDVTAGNNWFYNGIHGYEPATGLGTLDVAHLGQALDQFRFSGHGHSSSHGHGHGR
ncbi:S53 family peptidase [Oleiagrimonas sp. C23AA]|uniref:S53 family peptidase n=1 Tax=Oleiagrimonas sp. C23AA TaxID=2719047 RepID=UPI00141E21F4|nr:S53 family peptidase [Oleiagrimonas sp. C23AA]NII12186.1 S8/S53 family peptidase [Oleiagrimonas sp. C23AA]